MNWCSAENVWISSIPRASPQTWQTRTAESLPFSRVSLGDFGRLLPIHLPRCFTVNIAMIDEWLESRLAFFIIIRDEGDWDPEHSSWSDPHILILDAKMPRRELPELYPTKLMIDFFCSGNPSFILYSTTYICLHHTSEHVSHWLQSVCLTRDNW